LGWWIVVVVDFIFPRWRLPDYFLIKAKLSEVLIKLKATLKLFGSINLNEAFAL
jgi:hypothetical protein